MSQLLVHDPVPAPPAANPTGPDQGVIEEARKRQRLRRIRIALVTLIVAAIIGVIGWALSGGASHASPAHGGAANRAVAVDASDPHAPAFNVRLVPTLTVGQVGWCTVIEENGVTGGSACGGVPTPSRPFLQVYGWGEEGSHLSTTVAVTIPQVAAILLDGKRRVPTEPLPGLPYGLRAARIVTPAEAPARRLSHRPPGPTVAPLDAQGHPIPQQQTNTPFQGAVHSWRYPNRPPQGSCQLHAGGLPGLSARGGEVASAIRPFPGQLIGHAFLPCIATVYYLQHLPVRAMIVLDAAHPRARAAVLPDFRPVRGAPGLFAEGGLTARRSGNAWLIVGQGSGLAQRISLLRHLTITVRL
jgi:hypothetical protein